MQPPRWSREQDILILASYFDFGGIPPAPERQRLGNLMRRTPEAVAARLGVFAAADPMHPAAGDVDGKAAALWAEFEHRRHECMIAADEVTAGLRRLPHHIKKRLQE